MKDKFGILEAFFCKNSLINSITVSIFGWLFSILRSFHFKDLVNEGQILNFYRHFIYENFVMNFKISGFVGFTE